MIKFKKKVTLEFMGDEYKDSYIELESIPMGELEELVNAAKDHDGDENRSEALSFMRTAVEKRFLGGSVSQDGKMVDVTLDDVKTLPAEVFIEAFQQIVGKVPNA